MIKIILCVAGLVISTQTQMQYQSCEPDIKLMSNYFDVKFTREDKKQINCLAENIYHEARGERVVGMVAVTNVVMNRVADDGFPKTPCSVITEKNKKRCQFSWVCSKKRIAKPDDGMIKIAEQAYTNDLQDITGGALFFHANYIHPRWKLKRTAVIGRHIFYKGKT
jgi:spore germination cell wall hydrolase CwlJ-like protein